MAKSAAEKAAEVEAGEDVAAQKVRLGEQAALMLNAETLIFKKAARDSQPIREKIYQNFCKFTGSVGGHIGITNRLYRNDSTSYLFKDVPGHILSSLLPSVKLYKVFYPTKNDTAGFSWRIPFDDVPVKYTGVTSKYVENTLDELLSGKSRMNGVGIKSFHYKLVGTNPAEVNTNIEAELELYFQDVRDLVKRIEFNSKDLNFTSKAPDSTNFSFAYSDLVVDNPREERASLKEPLKYNDKYFRLKVICGYSLPNEEILDTLGQENAKKAKDAINSAKVILYLTPYKHDITFEENGAVTLKVQYIAANTSILANIDILAITGEHDKILELEKQFNETAYTENLAIEDIKNDCSMNQESKQKKIEDKQKELDNKLSAEKKNLENEKNYLYSSIFKRFIGLTDYVTTTATSNIYSVIVNQYAIGAKAALGDDTILENPTQRRLYYAAEARDCRDFKIINSRDISGDEIPMSDLSPTYMSKLKDFYGISAAPEDASNARKNAIEAITEKQPKTAQEVGDGEYEVKFVFLGDLLNVVLDETIKITNISERPRIILNDFEFEIPSAPVRELAKGLENLENVNNNDVAYLKIQANIADIPISLNMLQNLLLEKLIKTGRTRYPLISFLNDLMTEVIAPSVAPSVFGRKTVLNKSIRTSMLPISIPFINNGDKFIDAITGFRAEQSFYGFIDETKLIDAKIHDNSISNIESTIGNYLILYCSNQLPQNILKNSSTDEKERYDKDIKNGIYHFYVGSDKGIIKKINFSRTDTPFYKEARATNSSGDKSLGRLREVYDANITMFGNNIYRPGDFMYIEPLFFVGQAAIDLQNKIGLGGYYQVIDAETRFNENIFETNLRAVLAGYVEDGKVQSTESTETCK